MPAVYRYKVRQVREVEVTAEDLVEAVQKGDDEFRASPTNYKVTEISISAEKTI